MHFFNGYLVGFNYPERSAIVTKCTIVDEHTGVTLGEGLAICAGSDIPCKKIGRKIALKKALQQSMLPKEERKSIYDAYDKIGALKPKSK